MTDYGKSQAVRVADIVAIGPLMSYGGYRLTKCKHPVAGWSLFVLGFTTIAYNAVNWWRIRKEGAV